MLPLYIRTVTFANGARNELEKNELKRGRRNPASSFCYNNYCRSDMKNFSFVIILIFALLVSAVPAQAQEPAPLPEITSLYFPVVNRPCSETFDIGFAGDCPYRQYCKAASVATGVLPLPDGVHVVADKIYYRGEEVQLHRLELDPGPDDYYWEWFQLPLSASPVIYGSEVIVALSLDNGCNLKATSEYLPSPNPWSTCTL